MIREARPADAKSIHVLIEQLGYPDLDEQDVIGKIRLHQMESYKILVVEEGSRIVGFLTLHWSEMPHRKGRVGRITAMCTDETVRSAGIGASLVREAEAILKAAGCDLVEVTSNNRRTRAHAFYLKEGYTETSTRFVKPLK